jgi:hypothetical protein
LIERGPVLIAYPLIHDVVVPGCAPGQKVLMRTTKRRRPLKRHPADGIRQALAALGGRLDDGVLDAVARRFGVSPLVIRHQYENQLVDVSE